MEFELASEQVELQEAARAVLDDLADHDHLRAHLGSGATHDAALWRAMADQGWLGVLLPEDRGGLGLGWVEAAVLAEELGRHAAPVPYLPSLVAQAALLAAQRAGATAPGGLVEDLASGERIGCVTWAPASSAPAVRVERGAGSRCTLSGRLGPVDGAAIADVAVVAVGDAVYLLELPEAARPQPEPAMDGTRVLSWLELDAAEAVLLGEAELAAEVLDMGATGASADLLGISERALEMATTYASERVQFDRPIGSFQAVKHRCSEMVVDVEGMRAATWYAAWALTVGDPDASAAASTAKAWSSDAARRVLGSSLQVHGGIGFTWEHDLHFFMKRAQATWSAFGTAGFHRRRLGAALRQRAASGAGLL